MSLPERWLSIDPGESTGWAVWSGNEFVDHGTTAMWDFSDRLWNGGFDLRPVASEALIEPTIYDDIYLAGLMDGEAYVGVVSKNSENRRTGTSRISINMTTPEPLVWAQERYGGHFRGPFPTEHKDQYKWEVNAQADVYAILQRVLPYLKVKNSAAWKALTNLEKTRFGRNSTRLGLVVCEDWRLYPWELRRGSLDWDECRTARLIGSIFQYCRLNDTSIEFQPAKIKERAIAAGAEAYFSHPLVECRHQNDATMHGIFYIAKQNNRSWTDLSTSEWTV